jgi:hypothetical protein
MISLNAVAHCTVEYTHNNFSTCCLLQQHTGRTSPACVLAYRTYTRIDIFALFYSFLLNCFALRMAIKAAIALASGGGSSTNGSSSSNPPMDVGFLLLTSSFLLFYINSSAADAVAQAACVVSASPPGITFGQPPRAARHDVCGCQVGGSVQQQGSCFVLFASFCLGLLSRLVCRHSRHACSKWLINAAKRLFSQVDAACAGAACRKVASACQLELAGEHVAHHKGLHGCCAAHSPTAIIIHSLTHVCTYALAFSLCCVCAALLLALLCVHRDVSIPDLAGTVSGSSGLVSRMMAKWPAVCLFRPTTGILLAFLAHSNLVLPLWMVPPFQLVTLVAAMYYMRGVVCWYAHSAEALQLTYCCCQLRRTMRGIGILFTGMRSVLDADAEASSVCQEPITAAIVVLLFALVVVLVVLPVFATAYLEWSLKHKYVKHELRQQISWPFPKSVFCGAAVFGSWVVSSWFGCELAVSHLPPLTCSAASQLLLRSGQQL